MRKTGREFSTLKEAKDYYFLFDLHLLETDVAPGATISLDNDKYHPQIVAPPDGDRWSLYRVSDNTMYKPYIWVKGGKRK
jgi:hypothetical protein